MYASRMHSIKTLFERKIINKIDLNARNMKNRLRFIIQYQVSIPDRIPHLSSWLVFNDWRNWIRKLKKNAEPTGTFFQFIRCYLTVVNFMGANVVIVSHLNHNKNKVNWFSVVFVFGVMLWSVYVCVCVLSTWCLFRGKIKGCYHHNSHT